MKNLFEFDRTRVVATGVALGIASFALTGCADEPEILANRPAEVIGHEHHNSWVQPISTGKVTTIIVHPERFHISVRQCDRRNDEHADESGCVTAHLSVSEETYESFPDGSTIVFEENQ